MTRRRTSRKSASQIVSPQVIVTVAGDADVIAAVMLAHSRGLRISVRAGVHSWIATWLRDSGMVVDLPQFNGIGRLQFAI